MKLNIAIKDLKGEDIKDEEGTAVTALDLILHSLLSAPVEQKETHRKTKRFLIANKLSQNETKDVSKILTANNITEIMDAVKSIQPPIVVGRIAEIIDPNSLKEDD